MRSRLESIEKKHCDCWSLHQISSRDQTVSGWSFQYCDRETWSYFALPHKIYRSSALSATASEIICIACVIFTPFIQSLVAALYSACLLRIKRYLRNSFPDGFSLTIFKRFAAWAHMKKPWIICTKNRYHMYHDHMYLYTRSKTEMVTSI